MEKFNEFKAKVESLQEDAEKFYDKGNNAAGTRLRKGMMELRHLGNGIRQEVTDIKNN